MGTDLKLLFVSHEASSQCVTNLIVSEQAKK